MMLPSQRARDCGEDRKGKEGIAKKRDGAEQERQEKQLHFNIALCPSPICLPQLF
ncbi:hypothetical protein COLO4_21104 [Corchorus olitorius]|uniref:Uncharacterized protein n=1 Tax=Corchorus olitorius TaxID=93759 RepID=A0A1R3IV99_9ROSI|nr:hypothetical protein COLO4_21104 [Corchorus olitorius]